MEELKEKKCSKCGKVLPVTEFYKSKKSSTGYLSECKKCHGKTNLKSYYKRKAKEKGLDENSDKLSKLRETTEAEKLSKLKTYRKEALKAAKELHYSDEVIEMIVNASSEIQIGNIMKQAREEFWSNYI